MFLSLKKKDNRCSIIGYGRESVVSSSLRRLKFGPCISTIMRYYGELPEERKKITTDLVKQLSLEAIALNKPVRFSLHTNKMVTYSVYVDQIFMIMHKYDLDIYHRIPLVYAFILSESSDYFYTATRRMISQENQIL